MAECQRSKRMRINLNLILQLLNYTDLLDFEHPADTLLAQVLKYVEENYGSWDEDKQRMYFERFINTYKEGAYIITQKGKDIGFYNGSIISDEQYEVGNICIVPEYQRRGIGSAIIRDIIAENRDKEIKIQYFKQNPVGKLYERLGFELCGETAYHFQMVRKR